MKKIQTTIYQCEYCGRKMFGAGAMGRHEKLCRMNPKNAHKCYEFCKNLMREEITTPVSSDPEDGRISKTIFYCSKNPSQLLYSYKMEIRFPQYITPDMIRMPMECDLYEEMLPY